MTALVAASFAMTGVAAAVPASSIVIDTPPNTSQTNDRTPEVRFADADPGEHVVLQAQRASYPEDNWGTVDATDADNDGAGVLTDTAAITDPNEAVDLVVQGDTGGRDQIQIHVNVVPVFDGAHFSDGATVAPEDVSFSASSAILDGDVHLYIDGVLDAGATVAADSDGNISGTLIPSTELEPGVHTAFARTVDADGNESSDSTHISFSVAPPAPAFAVLDDDDLLNQHQPVLTVDVDPAATEVTLAEYDENLDDWVTLDSTTTIVGGVATLTPTLSEGSHQLALTQTVGTVTSERSWPSAVTVNTSAPVLDPLYDPVSNDDRPWFSASGLLSLNDYDAVAVKLYVDGQVVATDHGIDSSGEGSIRPGAPIADGDHTAYVTTVDDLGHEGTTPSNTISFSTDATAPAQPTVVSPADGSTVTTSSPTITLRTDPGAFVYLVLDGTVAAYQGVADSAGNVTFTLDAPLADGTHTLTFSAGDALGNYTADITTTFVVRTAVAAAPPAPVASAPVAVPAPIMPAPIAPAPPKATTAVAVAAPTKVTMSSSTLTAAKPIKVGFTLKKAGSIKVTITRVVRGKTVTVATVKMKAKAGKGSYTLKTKVGGKKLTKGKYKVKLQNVIGKKTSSAVSQQLTVG